MAQIRNSTWAFAVAALALSACGSDSIDGNAELAGAPGAAGNLAASAGAPNGGGAANVAGQGGDAGSGTLRAGSSGGGADGSAGASGSSSASSDHGGAANFGGGVGADLGGSAGTSGAAGSGATPGGNDDCNVLPVSPNPSPQAKKLLCYLYSQYQNHVLSGQQETSWSNPGNDISWYMNNGLKLPAILGGDFLYPSGTSQRAIAYFNAGGITMIRYHMGAPPNSDTYENAMGSANLDNVVKEGTRENTSFKSKLDYVAGELKKMQDANVPVIWAPFHEVQPMGWFWWSKGTGAQFSAVWKYMFDYLTATKGLNNLVWLLPFSGSPNSGYFPGKQYLDLAGPDTYATNQPFTALYAQAKNIIGSSVPIPLHETGMIPNPTQMFPSAAPWLLFNIWAGYQSDGTHNTVANIKAVYSDTHVVTRDEVPSLK